MAKGRVSGGTGLNLTAKLKTADALKEADKFIKKLNEINKAAGISPVNNGISKAFDLKPLTEYQAGLLKIKQEAADAARARQEQADAEKKAKQDQAAADKAASIIIQTALREERAIKQAANAADKAEKQAAIALAKELAAAAKLAAQPVKRAVQISTTQAEIEAYKRSSQGSVAYTTSINSQIVAQAKLNTATAAQAVAQGNLTTVTTSSVNATIQQVNTTNAAVLSKKQLAQMLAEEKLRQAQSTAELKNNAREQLNAKGSIEQRRAALIRLNTEYDRLSALDRNTASGERLKGIVSRLTDQVKQLEVASGRAQRNVGNYPNSFGKLGNDALTAAGKISQLNARLAFFQDALTRAKAPQSFVNLNRKIEETTQNINKLQNAGKKGFDDVGNAIAKADTKGSQFMNTVKGIGGAIAAAFGIQELISFGKESRELAAKGEGIREAFAKLDNGKTLELLRRATRGATSDIDLMAAALRAKNFQIAPELLAKGLELAGKVSRQTGQDVTYLTDSFVNGLGRKSLLILDNLQISQVQLRAELKKTGDFQTAVSNIVTKKLGEIGDVAFTTADKMAQFTANVANVKEKIGQGINFVIGYDGLKEANKEFYENGIALENLKREIPPLLSKYDELSEKAKANGGITKLSAKEQELMKDVIKQVGDQIPAAITQFDKYGNAIAISTDRAKKFIEQQVLVMQALNEDRIKKTTDRLADLGKELAELKKPMDELTKTGRIMLPEVESVGVGGIGSSYRTVYRAATKEEQSSIIKRYQDISKTIAQQEALRDSDSGVLLKKRQEENDKFKAITNTGGTDGSVRSTDFLKAEIKRLLGLQAPLALTSAKYRELGVQIKAMKDELSLAGGKKDPAIAAGEREESKQQAAVKARDSMQKKIDIMVADSASRQLNADDAEVESVRKKYKEMTEEAVKFNEDPKNKKAGVRVDGGKLIRAEKSEVQVVINKQSNERLKAQLANEAKDFEAFEQYKTQFGQQEAEKRFKNQFTTAKAYGQKLEDYQFKLLSEITDPADATESQKEQLDIVTEAIKLNAEKRKSIDDATYANAYQAAKTYIQKAQEAENDFQRDKLALGEMATTEQIANLSLLRDARIRSLNEENAYAASGLEELMMHYDEMTRKQISNKLDAIREGYRKEYAEGVLINGKLVKLTAEQLSRLLSGINQEQSKLEGDNPFSRIISAIRTYTDAVRDLGKNSVGAKNAQSEMFSAIAAGAAGANEMLGSVANGLDKLGVGGEGTQEVFKSVMGVVDGAGELAKGIASGNPVAIVTGSIKLLTSAVELFNTKDRKLEKQIKRYQADLSSLGKAYKQLERDVQDSVGNDIYSNQSAEIANLQQQQQKLIAIRNAESQKKKSDANKINDLNNQIDDIPNKIADINAAISQNLIQGTFRELSTSLANALTSGFKAGEDGITAMNKTFDDFIANAIQNSLKLTLLEPVVAQFTKELTEYAKGNGNSVLGFDFEAWKKKLDAAGKSFNEGLEASKDFFKGEDTTKEEASPNSLKGAYATASQESITLLAGQTSGMRIAQIETNNLLRPIGKSMGELFNIAKDSFDIAVKTERNTFKTANNTDRLENIETQLIQMNRKIGNSANAAKTAGF